MTSDLSAPLLAHAFQYCPRCASPNTALGQAPFRCTQCGYTHFFGPVAAVGGLVVNADNQLLMVKRARSPGKHKWGLPGGFVDAGEYLEQAMQREILEETQVRVTDSRYLCSAANLYAYNGFTAPVVDVFFTCRIAGDGQVCLDSRELCEYVWCEPTGEYLENMAFESNRRAILHWASIR